MRWIVKYAEHFRIFCDGLDQVTDSEFIAKIKTNELEAEDFIIIQAYLEDDSRGGKFFTDVELDDLIRQYIH